jgi:hypothetical protein
VTSASPYRLHFGFIYALLAAVLAAAVATTVVLAARDKPAGPPRWSAWQPVGDADAKIDQIRAYVSDEYRLETGGPFSAVRASPPAEQGVPIPNYVIRRVSPTQQSQANDFDMISAKSSVVYTLTMCGLTVKCEELKGAQPADFTRLLRRQALELALYTLKYVHDLDSVLVELPALTANGASPAILFQKSDLADELRKPLRFTLPQHDILLPGLPGPREAATIDRLTVTRLYQHSVQQDPSGAPLLVLDPVQP